MVEPGFGNENHGHNPELMGQRRNEPETTDMFAQDGNIDYLDIPAFLRNQAD